VLGQKKMTLDEFFIPSASNANQISYPFAVEKLKKIISP
jgi:hypothetical protein